MKRILSIILVVLMILGVFSASAANSDTATTEYNTPGKAILTVRAGIDKEYTQFSWERPIYTDWYELKVYDAATGEIVEYIQSVEIANYQLLLPEGTYNACVATVSAQMYEAGIEDYYTDSNMINFTVTEGAFSSKAEVNFNANRYELFELTMPFIQAKAKCESLGGHLVTMTSKSEYNAVNNLILTYGERAGYWIGLTDEANEGEWVNITGEPLSFTKWMNGEPNNRNNIEHYALANGVGTNPWNDVFNMYSDAYIGFICEYERCGDNASWRYDADTKTLTIYGKGELYDFANNETKTIPWAPLTSEIENIVIERNITSFGDIIFSDYENLSTITIQKADCKIGDNNITLPENVEIIGFDASTAFEYAQAHNVKFNSLGAAPMTVVTGDVNGDDEVTIIDATIIQQYVAKMITFNDYQLVTADVIKDDKITVMDATMMQRYIAKLIPTLDTATE